MRLLLVPLLLVTWSAGDESDTWSRDELFAQIIVLSEEEETVAVRIDGRRVDLRILGVRGYRTFLAFSRPGKGHLEVPLSHRNDYRDLYRRLTGQPPVPLRLLSCRYGQFVARHFRN